LIDVLIIKGPRTQTSKVVFRKHALKDYCIPQGELRKPLCVETGNSPLYKME